MTKLIDSAWLKRHPGWNAIDPKGTITEVKEESNMAQSNWTVFKPVTKSKFSKYDRELYIFTNKAFTVTFSNESFKKMGEPAYIQTAIDALHNRVGFRKMQSKDNAYLTCGIPQGPLAKGHPYICAKSLMIATGIKPGFAYKAYQEGEWLVVDVLQNPSSL